MGPYQYSLCALLVLLGYVSIHHLLLYLRFRKQTEHVYLSVICTFWGLHCWLLLLRFSTTDTHQVSSLYYWSTCCKFLLLLLFIGFFSSYLGLVIRGLMRWCVVAWCLLFVIHLFSSVSIENGGNLHFVTLILPTGERFLDPRFDRSIWYYPYIGLSVFFLGWILVNAFNAYQEGKKIRAGAVFIAIGTVLVPIIYNVAGDFGLVPVFPMISHSVVGMILSMNLMMHDEMALSAQLQASLDTTEARLVSIANAVPGIVFQFRFLPVSGVKMLYVSKGVKEFLGVDATGDEVFSRFMELLGPEVRERMVKSTRESLAKQEPNWKHECWFRKANGETVWLHIEASQAASAQGWLSTGVILDNTANKRIADERESAMRELEFRNEEQESVLYAASHDLKAPLVNVRGFSVELESTLKALRDENPALLAGARSQEQLSETFQFLEYIQRNMGRMEALIQNLLHVLRAGRVPLEMQRVSLGKVMAGVLEVSESQAKKLNVQIEVGTMPDCWGDPAQLDLVFSNLIDNAIKYRRSDVKPMVEIGGRAEEDRVVCWVKDNGRGFEPKQAKKVFELFHRLEPSSSEPGEGIGLTLVRRAVLRQGGSIQVESIPGLGTTFWMHFAKAE